MLADHPRLKSAQRTAADGSAPGTCGKLLIQIDGKSNVRHYGNTEKVTNAFKTAAPRDAARVEGALEALFGPKELSPEERKAVSAMGKLDCDFCVQLFDCRRPSEAAINKAALRKFLPKAKNKGVSPPMLNFDLRLCDHNQEFALEKERAFRA